MKLTFGKLAVISVITTIIGATSGFLADQYLTYPGERGPRGEQGTKGEAGLIGAIGPQGLQGSVGPTGQQGLQGSTGATGAQGIQGPAGATGPEGPSGSVSDSQLSSNVALLNRNSQTFTGANTINKTSTTAFAIQTDSGATNLLTADTTNLRITLGTAGATPVLLVLGTKNTTGDPTCTSGAIYYNSSTKQGKVCIDGAWSAVSAPVVTSLPSSPADGDEVTYQADATNGIYWHLRYRAASASAYKWEFLGGSELYSSVAASESTQSSPYVALATAGPSITLPLPGDYEIGLGATITQDSANLPAVMSFDIGATGAVDADSIWEFYSVRTDGTPGPIRNANVLLRKTGLSAVTLTAKYHSTGNAVSTFSQRTMRARPIRVGP